MSDTSELHFGSFRLQGRNGPLWRGDSEIRLQPKTLAVLWTLARQAGEVVTKTALMDAVWPRSVIGDEALTFQIQALRQALGDDARSPRYIATVHRVGFRFIATLRQPDLPQASAEPGALFVGRQVELENLQALFDQTLQGQRQLVFVTGEAGIGKTALTEIFLQQLVARQGHIVAVGRGQCMEHHGRGEAYLPILESLGRVLRQAQDERLIEQMRRAAPSWLLQMPSLLSIDEYKILHQQTAGTGRERMLREMTEAIELLSAEQPLVLLLEDLHWSDPSTLNLLSRIARRRERAQLMILCTYRPVEAIVSEHPVKVLKQDLCGRGYASELTLNYLDIADVRHYLNRRLGDDGASQGLAAAIHHRTDGHPLFMVQISDYLAQHGRDTSRDIADLVAAVPQGLQDLLELQFERLTPVEQQLLEIASVAGSEFTADCVATVADFPLESVETHCERLARQGQFIEERGLAIWPDGTTCGHYGFRHALYEQVLLKRVAAARRARLHRLIAERLESAYGERAHEIAPELAGHFGAASVPEKAITYRILAARKAQERNAPEEIKLQVQHGTELLAALPPGQPRNQFNLALLLAATNAMQATGGYGNSEVQINLGQIQQFLGDADDPVLQEQALALLWLSSYFQSQHENALRFAEQTAELGRTLSTPFIECSGLAWSSLGMHIMGRHLEAEQQSDRAVRLAQAADSSTWAVTSAEPGCAAMTANAVSRWILGMPDQALRRAYEGCARAEKIGNPYMLCATRGMALTTVLLFRREYPALLESCTSAIALCQQYGYLEGLAWAMKFQGVALCRLGQPDHGLIQLRQMIAGQRAAGSVVTLPVDYAHEAECCLAAGRHDEARTALDAAFEIVTGKGERAWEPELWRIRGELLLAQDSGQLTSQTEEFFRTALELARSRGALSLELRAATSFAHAYFKQGKHQQARMLLQPVNDKFTEGFDTPDLKTAQQLINGLS